MRPKIRLDPIVKLQEQTEEQRLREMAEADRKLRLAEDILVTSRLRAATDTRRTASASDWILSEMSHARALSDVRVAEQAVRSATDTSKVSRDEYTAARAKAEALRRVADARVNEILAARAAVERRELDEIGILRFAQQRAAA